MPDAQEPITSTPPAEGGLPVSTPESVTAPNPAVAATPDASPEQPIKLNLGYGDPTAETSSDVALPAAPVSSLDANLPAAGRSESNSSSDSSSAEEVAPKPEFAGTVLGSTDAEPAADIHAEAAVSDLGESEASADGSQPTEGSAPVEESHEETNTPEADLSTVGESNGGDSQQTDGSSIAENGDQGASELGAASSIAEAPAQDPAVIAVDGSQAPVDSNLGGGADVAATPEAPAPEPTSSVEGATSIAGEAPSPTSGIEGTTVSPDTVVTPDPVATPEPASTVTEQAAQMQAAMGGPAALGPDVVAGGQVKSPEVNIQPSTLNVLLSKITGGRLGGSATGSTAHVESNGTIQANANSDSSGVIQDQKLTQ